MNKKIILGCIVLFFVLVIIIILVINNSNKKEVIKNVSNNSNITNSAIESIEDNKERENIGENIISNNEEVETKEMIQIKVNNRVLDVKLEDNSSAKAFAQKLKQGDITVNAHEYGNFEKVGNLEFSLPTNDTRITTIAGDLMLYQGNQVTLFYGSNTWSYTRLGRIVGVSESELKNVLGSGDVSLVFSTNNK